MARDKPQGPRCTREAILPQELIDYVMDFLHDDRASLRVCTLVSHTWLPAGRLHLFSDHLVRVGAANVFDFLRWSRSCEFGPQYVRSVRFGEGSPRTGYIPVTKTPFIDLLARLTHIEHLAFTYVRFESEEGAGGPSESHNDPTTRRFALKTLTILDGCDTDSRFFNLATFFGIFRSVGRLDIRSTKNIGVEAMTLLARALPPIDGVHSVVRHRQQS
ncbi:hypothetical protein PHLGIDRAFT_297748 [Phlebiopsis gigantea 11061_1 CR5-6]|uniref:F-box domain-containing protein n=1 Tax=Phlebiopsis gigantea (strain 11061_1 CR5-6) TaxID=745531 RepID=A0A0C3PBN2_PHLG1|nr:hypothetical protein PHLGIDRAFT_297748 [Phlebiopsis gigantea 11061_1 CR5-6]